MCRVCHANQHAGKRWVIDWLIERAPGYWMRTGTWGQNQEPFERWLAKRKYKGEVGWKSRF